jgi:signal transduction histidine kinase
MKKPETHINEAQRLQNLLSYSILDTLEELDYDYITSIAAEICGTPIALISLIDDKRQWFKSHHGLDASETPKDIAFCAHAINTPDRPFIVEDSRSDSRFFDNPLVTGNPHVVFYAGVPLVSDEGYPLGTLCVIDNQPKQITEKQIKALHALSNQVINLLRLRKKNVEMKQLLASFEEKNKELEQFAYVAAHDLKSPLIGISGLLNLFSGNYSRVLDEEGIEILEMISQSSDRLRKLIDGLLEYSRCDSFLDNCNESIFIQELQSELTGFFAYEKDLKINFRSTVDKVITTQVALLQILINLISNAIKYNDKNRVEIEIGVSESDAFYEWYVLDNGPGIARENHEKIFRLFELLCPEDKFGQRGNGIGLATVKKLVTKMGGSVWIESEPGHGSKFFFTIKKPI